MSAGRWTPRAAYRALTVYRGAAEPCAIDLSDNTNRFGTPPAALAALRTSGEDTLTRYPSAASDDLRIALAGHAGVEPECIVTGCGSDDLLDCAMRAFAEPGDRVAFLAPTFVMAPHDAVANGLVPVAIPPRADGAPDLDGLLAARARVVYLCSPNNPTGGTLAPADIARVREATDGVVILDEAYAEFAGISHTADAPGCGNLLVTRTFSKAFGLAGLRIGWATGASALVRELEKARGPYRVGAAAERAAIAALTHDLGWIRARVTECVALRERFAAALRTAGFAPRPSAANFVLVPVRDARATDCALRARGIAVRAFTGLPGAGDALRITVGPWDQLERVLEALAEVA